MADLPDNPNNREEEYLADIAGLPNDAPENPWSRKEAYLAKISGRLDGIDEKIAALATDISLKGGVATYDDLPQDAAIGDAYITEDTGILYVWVGDEWTPLNMQGGDGGIKTLTTADYNYHKTGDTHDSIALWLLPNGFYTFEEGVKYWIRYSSNNAYQKEGSHKQHFIVSRSEAGTGDVEIFFFDNGGTRGNSGDRSNYGSCTQLTSTGAYSQLEVTYQDSPSAIMYVAHIVDALNNTSATRPLSANQGKILNDKIDAAVVNGGTSVPSTSTKGSVGTLYSCVNSGTPELYMCTAVSGSTYTWSKIV